MNISCCYSEKIAMFEIGDLKVTKKRVVNFMQLYSLYEEGHEILA